MTREDPGLRAGAPSRHEAGPAGGPPDRSDGLAARAGLRPRLVVAFVSLAVLSVVVLALLVLLTGRVELAAAEQARRQLTVDRVAALLGEAQDQQQLDVAVVMAAYALASAQGATLSFQDDQGVPVDLRDPDGEVGRPGRPMPHGPAGGGDATGGLGVPGQNPAGMGPPSDRPRMMESMQPPRVQPDGTTLSAAVDGVAEPVATVSLTFPATRAAPEQQLAAAVSRNVWLAVVVVAALAAGSASLVSRQLVRPVVALSATVERIARGDRTVRSGAGDAPGELGRLAVAIDGMADALDRQEQLRRELVANLTHELRTPLAVALGESEAVLDGVRPLTLEQVASIRDEVAMLTRLVGDLELLAAAQAAVLDLDREPIDVADLVDERLARARDRLDVEDRALILVADPGCVVDGDAPRLAQVVDNLIRNALAFTAPTGHIELDVQRSADGVVVTVRDDGVGIDPAERERVFDRFYRGAAATGVGGSGIGLAIVAELVAAHGGRVAAIEPPDGVGACVQVLLPAAACGSSDVPISTGSP